MWYTKAGWGNQRDAAKPLRSVGSITEHATLHCRQKTRPSATFWAGLTRTTDFGAVSTSSDGIQGSLTSRFQPGEPVTASKAEEGATTEPVVVPAVANADECVPITVFPRPVSESCRKQKTARPLKLRPKLTYAWRGAVAPATTGSSSIRHAGSAGCVPAATAPTAGPPCELGPSSRAGRWNWMRMMACVSKAADYDGCWISSACLKACVTMSLLSTSMIADWLLPLEIREDFICFVIRF
jgi:hypothetical protein